MCLTQRDQRDLDHAEEMISNIVHDHTYDADARIISISESIKGQIETLRKMLGSVEGLNIKKSA